MWQSPSRRLWGALALFLTLLATAVSAAVPPAPASRAARFGVYAWGFDHSAFVECPSCPDLLSWAADHVAQAGSRTLRIALGANAEDPPNPEDEYVLARLVAGGRYPGRFDDTPYARLFRDPRFDTYLLTVFTAAGRHGDWRLGFTGKDAARVRAEVARLGDVLLQRFPAKRFILLNWEGDNAIGQLADSPPAWDNLVAWVKARAAGVRDARERNPGGRARLFSGLEFNRVQKDGAWCGATGELQNRCVLDYVGPRVDVDYYSYSAWETLAVKAEHPEASLKEALGESLGYAFALLVKSHPDLTPARFLIGEAGFARTLPRYGECRAAAYLKELVESFDDPDAFGVSYVILWQVIDNTLSSSDWVTYGLYRGADGGETLPGAVFQALLAGTAPEIPAGCPRLADCPGDSANSCGVVNAQASGPPVLHPGSPLSLVGQSFSPAGNALRIVQGSARYTLRAGSPGWFESPERINVLLPPGLTSGSAILYVTDARGLDSNGQRVTIEP
jgi:hypothetical protein